MARKKINQETKSKTDSGDAATSKRVREHISNEGDVITDEDIRNAKTGDLEKARVTPENEEMMEKKIRDNEDNSIDTSWNILESQ